MAHDLDGRVCIITGASSGIGEVAATEIARKGATLGLICRDEKRGKHTVDAIKQETGNDKVTLHLADLKSQKQVRRVAKDCLKQYPVIHILINNAGVIAKKRSITEDGIEEVFAVNHLSHFLLTNLLLERLKASAPARIINVASEAYMMGKLDFNDIDTKKRRFISFLTYGNSKLATILFTNELARQLEGVGVTANCLHPGIVATRFGSELSLPEKSVGFLMLPLLRGPQKGAATTIYLATSPQVENITGTYFQNCKPNKLHSKAKNKEVEQRLWEVSLDMVAGSA